MTRLMRGDAGNAIVEFLGLAVVLMVPLVYLVLAVFRVQNASYAVAGAAREAGRAYVMPGERSPPGSALPADRARRAAALVLADAGLMLAEDDLRITCSAVPCLTPGASVEVLLTHDVALPFLPDLLTRPLVSVRVSGSHLEVVDRFRTVR